MALMFPRLARNFARNGYFPTDEATLERVLSALVPASGPMSIIDPCCGEGVAIAEVSHRLGRHSVSSYAVEFNDERARHAKTLVDKCLYADLMDVMISRQSFGFLWLNPPYGDLTRDMNGDYGYQGKGRARLEKLFYQKTLPLLQYGGVLVLIVPSYTLDAELVGWLTRHYTDLRVFRAATDQFKQVVVFGVRARQRELEGVDTKSIRARLTQVGAGEIAADELPEVWPFEPYTVPACIKPVEHFYRVSIEPEQFAEEIGRLKGLWPSFDLHLGLSQQAPRRPARAMSKWHLALALAAGAITGVVRAASGRVFVLKGDTHKTKTTKVEVNSREDGSVVETRILTDTFVPVIRAWDMTPDCATFGELLTIS